MKHYDDGRMDIMTRGGERFVMRELIEDRADMEARVFFFDDAEKVSSDDSLEEVIETAMNLLKEASDIDIEFDPSTFGGRIDPKHALFFNSGHRRVHAR